MALFALLPASAAAQDSLEVQPRKLALQIGAKASNGFELRITTEGHRRVKLLASKGPVAVQYTTTGRVSRDGIEADFGPVGQISLEFSGHREKFGSFGFLPDEFKGQLPSIERDCRGRAPVREVGRFSGEFDFQGERGFAALRARSLKGEVHRFYRRVCDPRKEKLHFGRRRPAGPLQSLKLRLIYLGAASQTPQRALRLDVMRGDISRGKRSETLLGPLIGATAFERVAGVRIVRSALAFGGDGSLILSPPGVEPVTATVAPGPPLEGTAKLIKRAGAPVSWSGSLLARLPGLGPIPLAGPGFKVSVCRPLITEKFQGNNCLRQAGLDFGGDGSAKSAATRLLDRALDR